MVLSLLDLWQNLKFAFLTFSVPLLKLLMQDSPFHCLISYKQLFLNFIILSKTKLTAKTSKTPAFKWNQSRLTQTQELTSLKASKRFSARKSVPTQVQLTTGTIFIVNLRDQGGQRYHTVGVQEVDTEGDNECLVRYRINLPQEMVNKPEESRCTLETLRQYVIWHGQLGPIPIYK